MEGRSLKQYRRGTQRTVTPDETLRRVAPFLLELGITRIAEVTGMDSVGIPTVMAVRPNARSCSVSQAAAEDRTAARAAGVMQAIEQHHAEHVPCALRLGSAVELRESHRVLEVDRLQESERMLWAQGRTLDDPREIWVPLQRVQFDLAYPSSAGGASSCDTNGLASGNSLEEAVVHGVCELIERDAWSLFCQRSSMERARRRVDSSSVDDALCNELLQRYASAGMELAIWDATSDLRVPCFLCCVLSDPSDAFRPIGLSIGAGCHVSRAVALSRALCEAAQRRLARLTGSSDSSCDADLAVQAWAGLDPQHAALAAPTPYCDVPSFESDTLQEDISWLQRRLAMADVVLAVVDLSRSKYPLHVVRVVGAGLEGNVARPEYQPGPRALRIASERGAA